MKPIFITTVLLFLSTVICSDEMFDDLQNSIEIIKARLGEFILKIEKNNQEMDHKYEELKDVDSELQNKFKTLGYNISELVDSKLDDFSVKLRKDFESNSRKQKEKFQEIELKFEEIKDKNFKLENKFKTFEEKISNLVDSKLENYSNDNIKKFEVSINKNTKKNQDLDNEIAKMEHIIKKSEESLKHYLLRYTWYHSDLIRWRHKCDFTWNDFALFNNVDEKKCRSLCLENIKCNHYTYNIDDACFLKNKALDSLPSYYDTERSLECGWIQNRKVYSRQELDDTKYWIVNKDSKQRLDASEQTVYLNEPNESNHQKWKIVFDDGEHWIINVATGKVLDSNHLGDLYTLPKNGGLFQKWTFIYTNDDSYLLKNKGTGRQIFDCTTVESTMKITKNNLELVKQIPLRMQWELKLAD